MQKHAIVLVLVLASLAAPALAGEVEIVDARFEFTGVTWQAAVTLRHADSGWEHYADAWRVVSPSGEELGKRVLYHPHVDEQPFTRSLGNIRIPGNLHEVYIEAHDKVHGWSPKRFKVILKK